MVNSTDWIQGMGTSRYRVNQAALVDYHIHTLLSDGNADHDSMISAALNMGLKEIGFSDHICLKDVEWAMNRDRIPEMVEALMNIRYRPSISVKWGVEMDEKGLPGTKIVKFIRERFAYYGSRQ